MHAYLMEACCPSVELHDPVTLVQQSTLQSVFLPDSSHCGDRKSRSRPSSPAPCLRTSPNRLEREGKARRAHAPDDLRQAGGHGNGHSRSQT